VKQRDSTLVHEAAHAVGGLLAGHRIDRVHIGATKRRPGDAGFTTFDFAGSPDVDMFGHVVAILMGPMAEGLPPLPWPPNPDPDHTDAFNVATLVNHLALSKSDYMAAVALADRWLDNPQVKTAIAKVAHALGEVGELTDRGVRDALGPELVRWFAHKEEPCSI
jgi:hypothetical protein